EGERERARGRRAAQREADGAVRSGAPSVEERVQQRRVLDGLRRGAVDLIEVQTIAEQRAGLCELGHEARDRELLLLVDGRVDAPVRGVAIAPLAADGEVGTVHRALAEPAGEEGLGPAVAACSVDV